MNNSPLRIACWLFTASIILILTTSTLIKHGMFMDAMLYTSVAHNLSQGIGTFWLPYFDEYNVANLASFHEQPPLAFGIISIFFKLFGSSMYVERFYVFFTMCMNAWLIHLIWKEISQRFGSLQYFSWWAILLWITIPVCFWSYSNNMNENTMSMFTLASVYLSYMAMQSYKARWGLFAIAGFMICLAALSKGFPGLFPITVPFLHWLFIRSKSFGQVFMASSILLLVMILVGISLYLYPASNESLSIYLFKRAFQRINEVPSVDSRFFILWRLISELVPSLLITGLLFGISTWKKIFPQEKEHYKHAFFFIAVGLSGSLPLMLTLVQNGFYMVAALPFYGIGFALLTAPILQILMQQIKPQIALVIRNIIIVLFIGSIIFVYLQKDKYSRDKELLEDIEIMASAVPPKTRINTNGEVYQNWSLNCYLVRMYKMSINDTSVDHTSRPFFITGLNDKAPLSYTEIPLSMKGFKLYKKQD